MDTDKKQNKVWRGQVIAKSGDKTVKVKIESRRTHPIYRKPVPRTKYYLVHDSENVAVVGDVISFVATRPLSARKRWRLVK